MLHVTWVTVLSHVGQNSVVPDTGSLLAFHPTILDLCKQFISALSYSVKRIQSVIPVLTLLVIVRRHLRSGGAWAISKS